MIRLLIFILAIVLTETGFTQSPPLKKSVSKIEYQCLPCGIDCDKIIYYSSGTCPHCQMPLVKKADIVFNTITPDAICNYIHKHPGIVLLDVRTKQEYDGTINPEFGTLKNAINIPIQELESRVSELKTMKNKEIIVFCSHSHRSPQASYFLTQNGFKKVTNMAGGMSVMQDTSCKK